MKRIFSKLVGKIKKDKRKNLNKYNNADLVKRRRNYDKA